jgi:hypothetical protein
MAVWRGWRDELFCIRLGVASFFFVVSGVVFAYGFGFLFWFDGLDRLSFFFLQGRKVVLCNRLESLCLEFNMFREKKFHVLVYYFFVSLLRCAMMRPPDHPE